MAASADNRKDMPVTDDLSVFFHRMPIALYRTAPDGKLLAANEALANLLGHEDLGELRKAVELVDSIYVDPTQRERWIEVVQREDVVRDFDVHLKRPDGTTIWVEDTARVIRDDDGEVMYFEGALIDVSDKVQAMRVKDRFIATVSHELRNPIAAMLGLGQELADGYDTFGDDERRELARLIARQAEDASWLIEDLLVAHREDPSRISLEEETFDLTKAVERVLEVVDVPVAIEVDGGEAMVTADPRRTRQIIRNLVENAVRYGGDEIAIRISSKPKTVRLRVCDSGPPIPANRVEQIFEPFETTGSDHPESVGLGLSVARRLARLMGGDLVYRHLDGLSMFVVDLPAA